MFARLTRWLYDLLIPRDAFEVSLMADLTTAQKAPLIITDSNGTDIGVPAVLTSDNPAVATFTGNEGDEHVFIIANSAGQATFTATEAGMTGTLTVTVEDAPLTMTLGAPEAK